MEEFCSMEEDWQAILGQCADDQFDSPAISSFGPLDIQNLDDNLSFNLPDLYEAINNNDTVLLNDSDEFYQPLDPIFHSFSPQAPISTPSICTVKSEQEETKILQNQTVLGQSAITVACPKTRAHATKFKRRKKQHKKVVIQVRDDGLSSDLWAWRKYGQKHIKGSPYPRSYYRCSTSKGCPARKQVEQSFSDPGMFTITYSAEHNHSQPTRRSCLAGTTRQRFPSPNSTSPGDNRVTIAKESSCSPISDIVDPSPSCPLMPSFEEVLILQQPIKHENIIHNEQIMKEISNDNEFVIPDLSLDDDFFEGLEDFGGLFSNSGFRNCSNGLENFDGQISNSGFYN